MTRHNILHLLKSYRERTGVSLQDMANIIGIDAGNLSKVEHGKIEPSMTVVLAYHLILKIPIEKLCKYYYPDITKNSLRNAIAVQDNLMSQRSAPHITKRITQADTIIDRLVALDTSYGKE